jgi:uncharacterized protein involved in propanediol utilization
MAIITIGGQTASQVAEGWQVVLGAAILGFLLTVLKSIAACGVKNSETGSLLGTSKG